MKIYKKVRLMREFNGWSQEEMAQRLEMSLNGYTKIERGESDPPISRIEQIAKVFGIELTDLLTLDRKNIIISHSNNQNTGNIFSIFVGSKECEHEIEKLNLHIQQKDKEISLLKQQNEDLRAMLDFLKK